MPEHPLAIFEKLDPALFAQVKNGADLALCDGALTRKHKLLIAMALDASLGATQGVQSLARQAMAAGATKEEILEAVRVAYHICGASSAYTAAAALRELFPT
jgi:alkylhydroperoxidase/carboxymuconolactone decarboxylase family protein YurZ